MDRQPTESVNQLLSQGRKDRANVVCFTGGEPLMDRRLPRFISTAKEMGYAHIEVETNGTIASLGGVVSSLVDAGLTKVWAAVMHADDSENDLLTRDAGGAQRSWEGFRGFADRGIEVGLSIAVLPQNVDGLAALLDRAVAEIETLNSIRFYMVTDKDSPTQYDAYEQGLLKAAARARKHRLDFRFHPSYAPPPCAFSERFVEICSPLYSSYFVTEERVDGPRQRIDACDECLIVDRCPGYMPHYLKTHPGTSSTRVLGPKATDSLRTQLGGVDTYRKSQMQVVSVVDEEEVASIEKPNIRVNWACNERCRFCWVDFDWTPPTREKVLSQVDELIAAGHRWVTFTGGEPTLVPWLSDAIRAAREGGMETVHLQSNGVHLSDERMVSRLVNAGLNEALISLHSDDAETSERITQTPNSWERSVQGIDRLVEANVSVSLSHVLTGWNHQGSASFVEFVAERWKGKVGIVWSVAAPITAASTRYEDGVLPFDEVKASLVAGLERSLELGVEFGGQNGTCGVPRCVLEDDARFVIDIPTEMSTMSGFVKPPECEGCTYLHHCRGVRESYVSRFGGRGRGAIVVEST